MLSPAGVVCSVLGSNGGEKQDKHGIVDSNGGKSRSKYKTRDARLKYKDLDVDTCSNRCVCKICRKSFKALQYFRRHVCTGRVRGQGKVRDKSYCCCQCGKLFFSFSGVRGHELKHCETTQDSDGHRMMMTLSIPHVQPGWRRCHCLMCASTISEIPHMGLTTIHSTTSEIRHKVLNTIHSTISEIPHMGLETETSQQNLEAGSLTTTTEMLRMGLTTIHSTTEIPRMGLETETSQQHLEAGDSTTTTTETQDVKHLKQHLCLESYSCHTCQKHSQYNIFVKAHKKTVHKNMSSFSCQVCGKQFQKQIDLRENGAREHAQDMASSIHGQQISEIKSCNHDQQISAIKSCNHDQQISAIKSCNHDQQISGIKSCHDQQISGIKSCHPKTKTRYTCCLCGNRTFSDKTCLAVHTASAHSHEKPLICEVCGKGFKLKNGLRAHYQTHSSERPYDCHLCDKSFKFKKDLKKHQERHKSIKEHVCEVCSKCFMTRNDVYLHQRVHDPLRQHRIYRPGVYRVSGGELVTARTRNNKMSLIEQEPISFDTEINTNMRLQWFKQ